MSVKIPFLNTSTLAKTDSNFFEMIKNRLCPNFQPVSFTSALIGACLIVFIVTRAVYSPGGYTQFLQIPTEMRKFGLDIQLIKNDKSYYYQTITSIFFHFSYRGLIVNLIFAVLVLYELQFCWKWGILASVVAAFAANNMAIATSEGLIMGFGGVVCAAIGISMAALLLHCSYIRQAYGNQFYMIFFFAILLIIMVIGMATTALTYFFSLFFGLLFGFALFPRMPEANINQNIDKLLKIFSAGFLVLAVMLGFIV